MIQVENLTKFYGRTLAIQDVNFSVKKGEILGFLGPNAAGKTTTLRIMTGFLGASNGTVKVDGYDVFDDALEVRRRIGYLPETVPLYPEMRVREYLGFFAALRGVPRAQRASRVDDAMRKASIASVADKIVGRLSKGFRQRVGIGQALVHDPPVLVLDEPTIGLDPRQIIETRRLIRGLGKNHTIILSTHILPEVSMTCDRVVIINRGRVVAEDTPQGLAGALSKSERTLIRLLRPANDVIARLEALDGVEKVRRDQPAGTYVIETALGADVREVVAAAAVENLWGLVELRPVALSLEDVFLHLTTEEEGVSA